MAKRWTSSCMPARNLNNVSVGLSPIERGGNPTKTSDVWCLSFFAKPAIAIFKPNWSSTTRRTTSI